MITLHTNYPWNNLANTHGHDIFVLFSKILLPVTSWLYCTSLCHEFSLCHELCSFIIKTGFILCFFLINITRFFLKTGILVRKTFHWPQWWFEALHCFAYSDKFRRKWKSSTYCLFLLESSKCGDQEPLSLLHKNWNAASCVNVSKRSVCLRISFCRKL